MKDTKRKQSIELVSKDLSVSNLIETLKQNNALYKKIIMVLSSLGNFGNVVNCDIYEIVDGDVSYIKLWCEDKDGNMFIFCPTSTIKQDIDIIHQISNDGEKLFNLSLAKNFEITKANVELLQTHSIFNCKFGRLVTDGVSFCNLFLSQNVCHHIKLEGNDSTFNVEELINSLNKLEEIPKLKVYLGLFENALARSNIQYESISVATYKDFVELGALTFNNNEKSPKIKK